jgi:hypothetical protein
MLLKVARKFNAEVIVAPPQTDLIRWQTQSFWLLGDARLSRSSGSLD